MTRPPMKFSTLGLALALASCSDSADKPSDSGTIGNNEAGALANDASQTTNDAAVTPNDRDAAQAGMDAGRSDGGSMDSSMTMTGSDAGNGDAGGSGTDSGTAPTACNASAAPDVGKLGLESVATGLRSLVFAAQPPGVNDWYLVQQTGQILVRAAGATTNTMFLDVSSEIMLGSGLGDDERGLLGLAFAPDFATSGLFYVMMTPTGSNADQVRQYQKTGSSPAMLKETLVTLPGSAGNHNGGNIVMRDGLLYVGTGDGGGLCNSDKRNAPQLVDGSPNALFGKILRLDPNRKANAFAAEGNPFPESPLVWHYGLRNPFRFSFDRGTGDMYIGDVGQDAFEEVNFAKAGVKGLNFGWANMESDQMTCGAGFALRSGSMHTKPVFAANRRRGCTGTPFCDWKSVIGGVVYRGNAVPKLKGVYVTGDYVGSRMVAFTQCDTTTSPQTVIVKQCDPNTPNQACFDSGNLESLVAIVEDNAGEMYFVANRNALLKVVAK